MDLTEQMETMVPTYIPVLKKPGDRWRTWIAASLSLQQTMGPKAELVLRQGRDFNAKPLSMQNSAHIEAKQRGYKVRTRIDGDAIFLRFWKASEDE